MSVLSRSESVVDDRGPSLTPLGDSLSSDESPSLRVPWMRLAWRGELPRAKGHENFGHESLIFWVIITILFFSFVVSKVLETA